MGLCNPSLFPVPLSGRSTLFGGERGSGSKSCLYPQCRSLQPTLMCFGQNDVWNPHSQCVISLALFRLSLALSITASTGHLTLGCLSSLSFCHSLSPVPCTLHQESPVPGPRAHSSPWPVGNHATQQEVSGRRALPAVRSVETLNSHRKVMLL